MATSTWRSIRKRETHSMQQVSTRVMIASKRINTTKCETHLTTKKEATVQISKSIKYSNNSKLLRMKTNSSRLIRRKTMITTPRTMTVTMCLTTRIRISTFTRSTAVYITQILYSPTDFNNSLMKSRTLVTN